MSQDRSALRDWISCITLLFAYLSCWVSSAGDWPMWRFDANRSAASPYAVTTTPQLLWSRSYGPRKTAWNNPLNLDLMPYDSVFEPIVMDNRMFLGFNDRDKVIALDMDSGDQLWEFFTGGPVRFPPAAWDGHVYVTSDDGFLYCLDASQGSLIWKFRGCPANRKALGNGRVISAWPARGGAVVRDGRVYFAASIWPFMGTFIYALEAKTGDVAWVNDSTGADYVQQPHGAPAFAGVAPQGCLVATERVLLVPGGRSVPAALDRATGGLLHFRNGKKSSGVGGAFVCANEQHMYVHARERKVRVGDLLTGLMSRKTFGEPVLVDGGTIWSDADYLEGLTDTSQFRVKLDATGDVIRAGKQIIAAGRDSISSVSLKGDVIWSLPMAGQVRRLLAAHRKLIAVTMDGQIHVFGDKLVGELRPADTQVPHDAGPTATREANEILRRSGASEGYAFWFGKVELPLITALIQESKLHWTIVTSDVNDVDSLRHYFDAIGWYGRRVSVQGGDVVEYDAPPYIANLVVLDIHSDTRLLERTPLRQAYASVRPFSGAMTIRAPAKDHELARRQLIAAGLEQARVDDGDDGFWVFRDGRLPGSGDWTHQYGNIANTVKSNDARVKLPLGVLWFGGTSNVNMLPRHGHGPPEQVIGGRTYLEGMNSISARDTYTGRLLWRTELPGLGTFGVYYDKTYKNNPLSTAYNQVHIPGANGRGTNFVATEDAVYVAMGNRCKVVDAVSGKITREISMPALDSSERSPDWAFIGVYQDVLLGGCGFANYQKPDSDQSGRLSRGILDMSASDGLVAFDRHTGERLWHIDSQHSFLHNGIVAGGGRVYCLDRLPASVEATLLRRGSPQPSGYRILAVDIDSGNALWEHAGPVFGTWLGYSQRHDMLLQAGARGPDRLRDEAGRGMAAYRGVDGEVVWEELEREYFGPCILHEDIIVTNAVPYKMSSGAFNLSDGLPHLIVNPITLQRQPWSVKRAYGCNSMIASDHLLTFRSGAAGFYDLASQSGTGNLGGFRSGCTSNLVVAGGVLNAPDLTRTCSCSYQNQTSLALVHMPDMEMWTSSTIKVGGPIHQVGINLGAPGDRRDRHGILWLDHPSVGGESPRVNVQVQGDDPHFYRRHASAVDGIMPWVAASGVQGARSLQIQLTPTIVGDGEPTSETSESPHAASSSAKRFWTVRLFFAEPEHATLGERVFDVLLQDEVVLRNFDIIKESRGTLTTVVKKFTHVAAEDTLSVTLVPQDDRPTVLSGIEITAEP